MIQQKNDGSYPSINHTPKKNKCGYIRCVEFNAHKIIITILVEAKFEMVNYLWEKATHSSLSFCLPSNILRRRLFKRLKKIKFSNRKAEIVFEN